MKPRETWTRRQFLRRAAAATFGMAGGLGLYAWRIEPHWVEVVRRPLPLPLLPPTLEDATLVLLGDLHVGPRVDEGYIASTLGWVSDLQPDIVALAGDYVSYDAADTHGDARARPRASAAWPLGDARDTGQPQLRDRLVAT